jgi:hypothetical protein
MQKEVRLAGFILLLVVIFAAGQRPAHGSAP